MGVCMLVICMGIFNGEEHAFPADFSHTSAEGVCQPQELPGPKHQMYALLMPFPPQGILSLMILPSTHTHVSVHSLWRYAD